MPDSPLTTNIYRRRDAEPGAPFVHDQDANGVFRTVTNRAFAALVDGFRAWYRTNTTSGELVVVAAARSADVVAALVAGMAEGRIVAPVNPKLRGNQLRIVLERASPAAVLADGLVLRDLAVSGEGSVLPVSRPLALINAHRLLPFHERSVDDAFPFASRFESAWEVSAPEVGAHGAVATWDPSADGLCLFTSGSTGLPKGVLIRNHDMVERARAEVELFEIVPEDVLLGVLPFSFDVGWNQMATAVLVGCRLVILDSWLPADIVGAVARFDVTGISCVPAIWRTFLSGGVRFNQDSGDARLRYATVSGGSLSEEEFLRLAALVAPAGVYKTYGQTEAFRLTAMLPEDLRRRPGSVGRAFASARVGVVDADLRPVGAGVEGEFVLAGLGAMSGYLGRSGNEEKIISNPFRATPEDPPFAIRTGDFGYLDSDGYVFLRGRRDAMIKVDGNRVYPEEVAALLLGLPGVLDAAAVGVPKEGSESLLAAFVTLESEVDESEFQWTMRRSLPPYMTPRLTIICEEIPKTPGGKPDLSVLARRAAAEEGDC
jgi:acyl-CoA synthetase (AMP-forming)/AMP-acid ligase II